MAKSYTHRSWTSADGLNLHYRHYAGPNGFDGLPVVCLHGLSRNARDFAELAEHISKSRRVIVPEMRGRGMSDYAPDSATYSPPTYVADVERLFEAEGVERFISVGTSMGGLMTMMLAQAKPGRIAACVINDIGPEIDPAGLARIAGYVGQGGSYPTWLHAARSLKSAHGECFPDYDLDQWLAMAKRTLVVNKNGRISYDYDMAIAEPFKQPGSAAPPDLWLAFEALRDVPTVLVRGELSDLLTAETAKQMGVRNPAQRNVTVPRMGHAPMLDEPEALTAIDALLKEVA